MSYGNSDHFSAIYNQNRWSYVIMKKLLFLLSLAIATILLSAAPAWAYSCTLGEYTSLRTKQFTEQKACALKRKLFNQCSRYVAAVEAIVSFNHQCNSRFHRSLPKTVIGLMDYPQVHSKMDTVVKKNIKAYEAQGFKVIVHGKVNSQALCVLELIRKNAAEGSHYIFPNGVGLVSGTKQLGFLNAVNNKFFYYKAKSLNSLNLIIYAIQHSLPTVSFANEHISLICTFDPKSGELVYAVLALPSGQELTGDLNSIVKQLKALQLARLQKEMALTNIQLGIGQMQNIWINTLQY